MDPVWMVLGGAALVATAARVRTYLSHVTSDRETAKAELAAIRQHAEADAVAFGEELAQLDVRLAEVELDEDARLDYQAALESYEFALRIVDRLDSVEQISGVVDALAGGRYAKACVLARVEGTPLPAFRTPCFFDPSHGPAATEVLHTAAGRGTRKVPACAQDAARQADDEKPSVRTVWVNGKEVPYWAAGGLHQPYENGYVPRTVREATLDHRASYNQFMNSQYSAGGFPT